MITYLCISRISSNRYLDSSLLLREENHLHIVCRFDGVAPEPREGVRSGHIPGTKCVPFPEVGYNANMQHITWYLGSHRLLKTGFIDLVTDV